MPLHLYLIRHGETEWSLSHQHTGHTDIPLTEHGEQDARKLGARLCATKFDRVFTSPMQRARRTCELVGLATGSKIEPDLSEWDYGDYEGQCTVDIRKKRPDWNIFREAVREVKCPRKFPTAPTGSSPAFGRWTEISHSSPTANSGVFSPRDGLDYR